MVLAGMRMTRTIGQGAEACDIETPPCDLSLAFPATEEQTGTWMLGTRRSKTPYGNRRDRTAEL
jgi:hypothetical protein